MLGCGYGFRLCWVLYWIYLQLAYKEVKSVGNIIMVFECPKCADGEVKFKYNQETSLCKVCGAKWRLMLNIEEVNPTD